MSVPPNPFIVEVVKLVTEEIKPQAPEERKPKTGKYQVVADHKLSFGLMIAAIIVTFALMGNTNAQKALNTFFTANGMAAPFAHLENTSTPLPIVNFWLSSDSPITVCAGENFTVQLTINILSSAHTFLDWHTSYLQEQPGSPSGMIVWQRHEEMAYNPGETKSIKKQFPTPPDLPPGNYILRLAALKGADVLGLKELPFTVRQCKTP